MTHFSKSNRKVFCGRECHKHWKMEIMIGNKRGKGHPSGVLNPNWKGDKVGYWGLHAWVYRLLGKPMFCSLCKTTKARKYEWANISQLYKRDILDWIRLCSKCHINFDNGNLAIS